MYKSLFEDCCRKMFDIILKNKIIPCQRMYLIEGEENISIKSRISDIFENYCQYGCIIYDEYLSKNVDYVYGFLKDEDSKKVFIENIELMIFDCVVNDINVLKKICKEYRVGYSEMLKSFVKMVNKRESSYQIEGYSINTNFYVLAESWIGEIYKLSSVVFPPKGGICMDVGGYKGETSIWMAKIMQGMGKIFSFEVNPNNYKVLKNNVKVNGLEKMIIPINMGLSDISQKMYGLDCDARTRCRAQPFGLEFKLTTLDEFISANMIEKIDYIKMDIEGMEYKALIGARETIKKYKPMLAISVYHNYNDIFVISKLLKNYNKNYSIYFRKVYKDTILFAING